MKNGRRTFIRRAGYGAFATAILSQVPARLIAGSPVQRADTSLYNRLLKSWCDALISVQGMEADSPGEYGGFMCPACGFIHGRSAEAAFPLLYMAGKTKDRKYYDSAIRVFEWGERNVSQTDGSWLNDVTANPWKGITIFGAAALGESLKYHNRLLDVHIRAQWTERLRKACEFIYGFITADTSNINYPLCASYPLVLGGKLLKEQKFTDRGRELARVVCQYLTPGSGFIYGELKPRTRSPRGFWPVDLSYNVEETLPTLTLYALEMRDREMLDTIRRSWKVHLEFMLPDGAWDDSFGTRNHKWTYWGSRNSDGCQAGLALLEEQDPVFAEAAYRNALMLEKCTHNGFLHGGPGYAAHGVRPCIHHNFAHAKSLASLLSDSGNRQKPFTRVLLPRETATGIKTFGDIGTQLISAGKWRATVTANDTEYLVSPHASGGSISLLYHQDLGLLLTDSLFPELKPRERSNMQGNSDTLQLLLTPRLEVTVKGRPYRSSRDLHAEVASKQIPGGIQVTVGCRLLSHSLEDTPGGPSAFILDYFFRDTGIEIRALAKNPSANNGFAFYLPVVSASTERVSLESPGHMVITRAGGRLKINTSGKLNIINSDKNRVFSQSPGVEALPLKIDWDLRNSATLTINITAG